MADLEDVTLDGRPLQSLRVADLKAALEERGLSKSGQKNALIKRLKGALMLENLQRTSTAHIGLQPNSQIGEEMSQNSFIKQYLAKQQELLRQRLEREAREAYETNDQEDHAEVNNSTSCPPQAQDVTPALPEQHKPPGPSGGEGFFSEGNDEEGDRNNEADMSSPPASGSVAMRVPGGEHRPERGFASSEVAADSDDDDSEEAEEDGDDDDWDSGARRRNLREPARVPSSRERSGASCQPQQQHIPSLLSPQLRQPTPPPSPPPELSFPLPDTPKQSPPSPDVAPPRHSPSTSSSGSSSSGSRSSSPEPQRSGHTERKPGPLTLLARKMESEGAFSGAGWHGGDGEGDRHDSSSPSATLFPSRGPPEGLVSAITHTANTAGHMPFPMIPGTNQGVTGAHSAHIQVPVSVLKATATEERDRQRDLEIEREELERQRKLEQEKAMELERERALALEREEKQRALERERIERQQALEREEREKALQRERALALERERKERELVLERERQERELALERDRQERELALAKEREEREQALARERKERELVLERERRERELLALAKEMEEREQALARERALERQKELERQRALEQERLQREREDREKREREEMQRAMELERAKTLERERQERDRAIEQERLERERALEAERRQRIEREKALEQEKLERFEREKALEHERLERERALEQERIEKEKALERERIEKEKALERERIEREKTLERERIEREKALELERIEREKAIQQERLERERALEQERSELERKEKERIERERVGREKALEREREEKERAERKAALEKERMEKERAEKERKERLEREKLEQERALEKERKERALKEERERALERQRKEKEEQEKEQARMAEKERESHLPPSKRGRDIGLTPLPTPPSLSTGPARKLSTEAGAQEDVHAQIPRSESQAAESSAPMSPTPLSQQSSFKKFRFLRDSPIQPQPSSTSMVIKRPRTFSDTPQPQASPVLSPSSVTEQQQQGGHRPSAEQEDRKMQTKPEVVAGPPGPTKNEAAKPVPDDREQADSVKAEHAAKDSTQKSKVDESKSPSSPLAQREGRDAKKQEKQTRRRSTSNDSSSSESGSESSSSRSSRSSASSQEETSSSRNRREVKPVRDSSPQHRMTVEILAEGSKEIPKATPLKRAISGDMSNTTADGDSHIKKPFIEAAPGEETQRKRTDSEREEEKDKQRQVKETGMAESEKLPENSEETPKAFSARKISLSSNKLSPGPGSVEGEQESGAAAGRKRRWGSSTAVTAKKPSISITTDSLKSLIPDIRPCLGQEAIVDLHPEEAVLSGVEDEERERSDQDLQIRRTVTQVVHLESKENGQKEVKRSRHEELEEEDLQGEKDRTMTLEEKMDTSFPGAVETQSPSHTGHDVEINTVTPSDTLIRRSISQQKTGVSITIDDPVRTSQQPSPPRGKVSNIVHVCNLVRPFTLGQLKELLSRTGTLVEDSFWIDKIKSHCYVTYSCSEEAVATREALHGVKWPQSNPKVLSVDFCQQDELDFHKGLVTADRTGAEEQGPGTGRGRTSGLPSLLPERDQWAEREREMERRERAKAEREWDRDKVKEFGKPGSEKEGGPRRSRSRERKRKERGKSKEKKTEKKEKAAEDPPAKLLDDLFRKTKAAPCIYWLPLTDEQFIQRETARADRAKEREKRRKEQEEEEEKKREEERKERMKAGGGTTGDRSEGEKDKDRERDRERGRDRDRERERENDKRRDGYRRQGGSGAGGGGSRRSRSRSDPRERRR
ncbi:apoptotic chromatin condensation inducer in the nucleus [Hippoglossus stenolepis]|uniref:apoptotic chromatin condensation inducer in the nucleus n=1 Tax=Hippoglossus stenolepis TaxID=195615 RepID=UPI00159C8A1B|nr:apoptotic chromatin condensation inducer in the nucleus [Hippoglossus stenolepis]